MPVSEDYIEFVRDLLSNFEPLHIRRMFGGVGIYAGERFFAILADDTLYLKADDGNRANFEQRGLKPFNYETKTGRTGTMSYYPAPAESLEDPDVLAPWVSGALAASERADARKGGKRRKP